MSQQESRAQRYRRYTLVHDLLAQGLSKRRVAQLLGMSRTTVNGFARAETFPERRVRQPSRSQLDPYLDYLQHRWAEGCHTASQLWRELQDQGYTLSRRQVMRWAQQRREEPAPTTPKVYLKRKEQKLMAQQAEPSEALSPVQMIGEPRQFVWLMLRRRDELTAKDRAMLEHIVQDRQIGEAYALAQRFRELVRERDAGALSVWLEDCAASRIVDLRSFAASLRREQEAVLAAVEKEWSTGQVEGQNTRVKLIKRQMYGRAKFDLLRQRVLYRDVG
jgi:transposase